jgi:integrase
MATKTKPMPRGVQMRVDADGKVTYRVRVRRGGGLQTATLPTLEEALAWRARAVAAARGDAEAPAPPSRPKPAALPREKLTVEQAARRLVLGMRDGSIRTRDGKPFKPSVVRKYEEALRLVVLPLIGAVPVDALRKGDVQQLVDSVAAQRTAEHARKALTALRTLCRTCEAYGELEASPCSGVRVPVDPEPEKPARILTPQEAEAIIRAAYADDERLGRSFGGPLIRLAFATGLRLGELLALPWGPDGLDLAAGVVHVRRSLDRVRAADGSYPLVPAKSSASRRDVPLAADDVAAMRRHLLASGRPRDGALVFALEGEAPSPVPAYRGFRRACFRAGVLLDGAPAELRTLKSYAAFQRRCRELELSEPLPRFHDTRHAYATHALAAGLSAHAVARLLGHSDAGLVWRRYGHALPDELARAADAVAAFRAASL